MQPVVALRALGGVARDRDLRGVVSRRALRRALEQGLVRRDARGVYSLPPSDRARVLARRLRGVLSHRVAAVHWGYAVPPGGDDRHNVTIGSHARRRDPEPDVRLRYRDLPPEAVQGDYTSPLQTVVDCLRDLPLRDALAIGDSALRSQQVQYEDLAAAVTTLTGPGSAVARRRLALLDARSENAFESACRAILIEAGITGFRPQLTVRAGGRWLGRVDLGHPLLRIVIECDSFAHHADRMALRRDCRRYTAFVAAGWYPLRFSWEDVMVDASWVVARVADVVALRSRRTNRTEQPAGASRRVAA